MDKDYALLLKQLNELAHLSSAYAVLNWDQEVSMPPKGAKRRAETLAHLRGLIHEECLALNHGGRLEKLNKRYQQQPHSKQAAVLREVLRGYTRERKLPTAFVKELSETCSLGQQTWAKAREQGNFKLFLPVLKKIVDLKRREAKYVGYTQSAYDALLDEYEPGLTSRELDTLFAELKMFLIPSVKKWTAKKYPNEKMVHDYFPLEAQKTFNERIAHKMGFDLEAGRIDISTHPFTTNFHPEDVRITTRYQLHHALYAISSTIHETGHALYEQGLPAEAFGTPLGEAISLGIHESQSRLWENHVGKGLPFWKYFYPLLQKTFPKPFRRIPLKIFHQLLNGVKPSFIRTEADEVTYNLHIILRYEIEKDLIEGRIEVKDLPAIWNKKVKDYFGLRVPNDRLGVLQDVHWSIGAIGYFPTYTLGNLYAAQWYAVAKKQLPKLEQQFTKGNFTSLREWLRKNIHQHGKRYSASTLIKKVTGEPLRSNYFIEYLKEKYN